MKKEIEIIEKKEVKKELKTFNFTKYGIIVEAADEAEAKEILKEKLKKA